jgi:hypothetical protein
LLKGFRWRIKQTAGLKICFSIAGSKQSITGWNNCKNSKYFDAFPQDKNIEACFYISQVVLIGNIPNWKCATNGILGRFDYPNRCSNSLFRAILMNKMCKIIMIWCFWYFPSLEHVEWSLCGNYLDVSLVDLHYPIIAAIFRRGCLIPLLSSVVKIHEQLWRRIPTDEIDHFVLCNFDTFCNFEPWFTCKYKLNKSFTIHCIS